MTKKLDYHNPNNWDYPIADKWVSLALNSIDIAMERLITELPKEQMEALKNQGVKFAVLHFNDKYYGFLSSFHGNLSWDLSKVEDYRTKIFC